MGLAEWESPPPVAWVVEEEAEGLTGGGRRGRLRAGRGTGAVVSLVVEVLVVELGLVVEEEEPEVTLWYWRRRLYCLEKSGREEEGGKGRKEEESELDGFRFPSFSRFTSFFQAPSPPHPSFAPSAPLQPNHKPFPYLPKTQKENELIELTSLGSLPILIVHLPPPHHLLLLFLTLIPNLLLLVVIYAIRIIIPHKLLLQVLTQLLSFSSRVRDGRRRVGERRLSRRLS